tara:strand:+ start:7589 stop:8842 length:1254 start_codon:yes stop_codon:yes gene_type:complete
MLRLNKLGLLFLFFLLSFFLSGQTKKELKKQKKELEKEINYTTKLLSKTEKNKTKSLNYLKVLRSQINSKEKLLVTLNIEINLLKKQINKIEQKKIKTEELIIFEKENLQKLREEYAKMIYAASKKKGQRTNVMFIFSSLDFNQAYKRILYLKQYSVFRKIQANKIQEKKGLLIKNTEKLVQQKDMLIEESARKRILVQLKKKELESIGNSKNEKQELLQKLKNSEKRFKKQLQDKQKQAQMLDQKIRKIIEEEIRKSRDKLNNTEKSYTLTPESIALSSGFINNKGKLPWPLEKGVIVGRYGKQKHVVFAGVETFNNGIDIATEKNTDVTVVFDGTVSRIFFIKGEGKAILINHGDYFSVYSGLKEVTVKAGDKLLAKEKIGVVITHEEEKKTELHFEIWNGYDKQNPSNWLYNAD